MDACDETFENSRADDVDTFPISADNNVLTFFRLDTQKMTAVVAAGICLLVLSVVMVSGSLQRQDINKDHFDIGNPYMRPSVKP